MGWNDYYARRAVMDAALEAARRDPAAPLPFAHIDRAADLFGTPEQLLLALYHRWTQRMTGLLRAGAAGPEDAATVPDQAAADYPDRVAAAWRETRAENQTLRAVLDANIERYPGVLLPALENEQRILALTAGLADLSDTPREAIETGAGFLALIRHGDDPRARQHSPMGQLLRFLAPTG